MGGLHLASGVKNDSSLVSKEEMSLAVGIICRTGDLHPNNQPWIEGLRNVGAPIKIFRKADFPERELSDRCLCEMYASFQVDFYVMVEEGEKYVPINDESLTRSLKSAVKMGVYHKEWSVFTKKFLRGISGR